MKLNEPNSDISTLRCANFLLYDMLAIFKVFGLLRVTAFPHLVKGSLKSIKALDIICIPLIQCYRLLDWESAY